MEFLLFVRKKGVRKTGQASHFTLDFTLEKGSLYKDFSHFMMNYGIRAQDSECSSKKTGCRSGLEG